MRYGGDFIMEDNMRGHACCNLRVDDGFEHGETDGLNNHKDILRDPMRDEIHYKIILNWHKKTNRIRHRYSRGRS